MYHHCTVLKQVGTHSESILLSTARRPRRIRVLPQWFDGVSNNNMSARQLYHCGCPIQAVGTTSISLLATTIRQSRWIITTVLPPAAVLRDNDRPQQLLLLRRSMQQQRSLATKKEYKWGDERPKKNKKEKPNAAKSPSSSSSPQKKAPTLSSLHTTFDLKTYRGYDAVDDVSHLPQTLAFHDVHVVGTDRDTSPHGTTNPLQLHDTSAFSSSSSSLKIATDSATASASDTIVSRTTTTTVATTTRTPMRPNDGRSKEEKKRPRKIAEKSLFHPKNRTCPKCHRLFGGHFRMMAHLLGTRRCLIQCDDALQRELRTHVSHVIDSRALKRDDRKLKRYTNDGRQHQDLVLKYHDRQSEGSKDADRNQDEDVMDDDSDSENVSDDDHGGLHNPHDTRSKAENDNL